MGKKKELKEKKKPNMRQKELESPTAEPARAQAKARDVPQDAGMTCGIFWKLHGILEPFDQDH